MRRGAMARLAVAARAFSASACGAGAGAGAVSMVELQKLKEEHAPGRLTVLPLDVTDESTIEPGMDLAVTHVHREQVPSYGFEQGYKKPCPTMHANQQEQSDGDVTLSPYLDSQLKRKYDSDGDGHVELHKSIKRASVSPPGAGTPPHGNSVSNVVCDSPVKFVSSVVCSGAQTSPSHDDMNLEQAQLTTSPYGSEDTSASGTSFAAVGAVVLADESSKLGNLTSDLEVNTIQTMPVHTSVECVAQKDETKLEEIRSLASSNCAEFVESSVLGKTPWSMKTQPLDFVAVTQSSN